MSGEIEKLEINFAYLQDKVEQLNEIVVQQSAQIAKLEKQNEFLAKKVAELDTETRPDRRPPHY